MNASSQIPPGALPPETPYERQPVPPGVALATAAPLATATPAEAAAAVIDARMAQEGGATGAQLAEAESRAGILFDAAHVQAAVDAARDQAAAEHRAELADLRQRLITASRSRRQRDAVLRLCEGRRGDDMLLVAAVAAAAEYGNTAVDGVPMILGWTETISLPDSGSREDRAVVECVSSYGGRADLALTGPQRQALASLLDLEIRDIHAPCPTPGCGEPAWDPDKEAAPPGMSGWACVRVAGVSGAEGEPHWYCSPVCVSNALARAGAELAEADHRAELDGGL